jgi:hypothetical protein
MRGVYVTAACATPSAENEAAKMSNRLKIDWFRRGSRPKTALLGKTTLWRMGEASVANCAEDASSCKSPY